MEPIRIVGPVVQGLGEGRTLGYPTLNIGYNGELSARHGSYAADVIIDGVRYDGAAVVGGDFLRVPNPKLEVHVLDTELPDMNGQEITLVLREFIADLEHISTHEEIIEKINRDIALIRNYFATQ